jgi:hypothetical protein
MVNVPTYRDHLFHALIALRHQLHLRFTRQLRGVQRVNLIRLDGAGRIFYTIV